jgi:hypothetical protein
MARPPGKAGVAAVPVTLDASTSPRVREAVRLVPAINGRPPTATDLDALSAQLYGNSAELGYVTGDPWAASS